MVSVTVAAPEDEVTGLQVAYGNLCPSAFLRYGVTTDVLAGGVQEDVVHQTRTVKGARPLGTP